VSLILNFTASQAAHLVHLGSDGDWRATAVAKLAFVWDETAGIQAVPARPIRLVDEWAGAPYDSGLLRAAEGWYTDVTEEPPCLLISAECPEVVSAFPMLICNPKNPQDVKKMDGQVSDDVADCARYGLKTYLGVADKPLEVERQEVFERHQDPQERAMTMLAWDAENERGNYISRTPRG